MQHSVYIRPLELTDAQTSWKWRNIPEVWIYTPFRPESAITEQTECDWLTRALSQTNDARFAICTQTDDRYIGNVQLLHKGEGEAELHLFIGEREYWGKGIGQQVSALALEYAFKDRQLQRVLLSVDPRNQPARSIYRKMGFIETGGTDKFQFLEMELTKECYFNNIKNPFF